MLLAFVVVVKDDIHCQVLVAAQDTGAICLLPALSSVFVFICKSFGYSSVHQGKENTFNCSTEEIRNQFMNSLKTEEVCDLLVNG